MSIVEMGIWDPEWCTNLYEVTNLYWGRDKKKQNFNKQCIQM